MTNPIIDPQRSTCFCDVGNRDYIATIAVDDQGEESFWLARKELIDQTGVDCGSIPAHERTGPLQHDIRYRIWGDLLACGRPTKSGQPCCQIVSHPGDPCHRHQGMPRVDS